MEFILDSSVFPTLPAGGSLSHADLMGRPRPLPTPTPSVAPARKISNGTSNSSNSKSNPLVDRTATSLDGHGQSYISSTPSSSSSNRLAPPRPGMGLRRVSSFSGSVGNQAGIGAVGVQSTPRPQPQPNLSANSLPARSQGRRGSIIGPARPLPVKRRSSFDEGRSLDQKINPYGHGVKGLAGAVRSNANYQGHHRTASDSTASTIKVSHYTPTTTGSGLGSGPTQGPPVPVKDTRSNSIDSSRSTSGDGSIRLGRPDQVLEISRLINTLHGLTPPSRDRIPPKPKSATSSLLHPSLVLTPLAIILESLVNERSILKQPTSTQPIPDLPTLKDGSSLQLAEGEIDWSSLRVYTRSLGNSLDQTLPFIQNSIDRVGVEEMVRSVRMFVGKIKKVFAEVVQGYGNGYGFLKGWWDDTDMKGCAGEIGRWCDLFDV